ncbi:hypothetical protein O181_024696 [Austropuccinia psidii MF-1]|uniref:Uncharacterized protein n=1 Tax=Austropuccinia psidii MF-1 TaxID=1389203 RepID=A0A9Q3CH71_9BASI|nr:hypothetical protein [Austropuccinia psidii MF-1]
MNPAPDPPDKDDHMIIPEIYESGPGFLTQARHEDHLYFEFNRFTVSKNKRINNQRPKDRTATMASEGDNENRQQPLSTLSENNYPEWRRRVVILLNPKKLYHHCVDATLPVIEDDARPSAAKNKVIDANAGT